MYADAPQRPRAVAEQYCVHEIHGTGEMRLNQFRQTLVGIEGRERPHGRESTSGERVAAALAVKEVQRGQSSRRPAHTSSGGALIFLNALSQRSAVIRRHVLNNQHWRLLGVVIANVINA
jgi:hypothetical protein